VRLPILSLVTFVPLAGALALLFFPRDRTALIRWFSTGVAAVTLGLAVDMVARFDPAGGLQLIERAPWVPSLGMQYFLGVDGISLPMVLLAAILSLLAVVASWTIQERVKQYFVLFLVLESGMIGVFLTLDLVLFYAFWEVVLVPMYFLIGIWGGPRREYAAIKFFLYTLLGSVLMLLGIVALHLQGGTFDMIALTRVAIPSSLQMWIFAAFFVGFAVKVPIWPLHTWLPDAHVEAPTAISVILAGVLLKMGAYGFLRISLPVLPQAAHQWAPWIAALAAISIVYGAAVAMAQKDLKRMIAYSSVSHMGYVMLGIAAATPVSLQGSMLQMFAHGIVTGLLFLLVGLVYERAHTREIPLLGGLSAQAPILGGILSFASFASLGLPGLASFVGEFMVLLGTWTSALPRAYTVVASLSIVLTAAYFLRMLENVALGPVSPKLAGTPDVGPRELSTLVPLVALTVVVGLYPVVVLTYVQPAVTALLKSLGVS
jgi:NADH-quinone oxidoreductase subunit M